MLQKRQNPLGVEGRRADEYEKQNPNLLGFMLIVCCNRKFESQLLFQQPVQVNELPHSSDQEQSGIPALLCEILFYFSLRCIMFLTLELPTGIAL